MGRKSQRRKERLARKERQARKRRKKLDSSRGRQPWFQRMVEAPLGSNTRHQQRLARQRPRAWTGETPEDVAVFDDSVLSTLPPELAQQVSAVREALQGVTESNGENAVKVTAVISRGSPLSEWRLFIRGLVDWRTGDTAAASEAWGRLDRERRPGRIATALMLALRSDLELLPAQVVRPEANENSGDTLPASTWDRWDEQLLYHAKLVRRVRFDRAALRLASAALNAPEESNKLLLGPRKIQWLKQFVREYGETEPALIAALAQAALGRAFAQPFSDLFNDVARSLPGPRHDRLNQLFTFFYYSCFANDASAVRTAQQALDQYLNFDLPRNEALTQSLRGAIASQVHFYEAKSLIEPRNESGFLGFGFGPPEDFKSIRKHFRAASKAYPQNLAAHKAYAEWLESKLDNDRLTQAGREPFEEELADVMRGWSQGLPECVEPRLWLVDYLLEKEQLEEAKPHVDFLAAARQDDPRVRATPWKWQLQEAMRLCRRKAWLAEVPARLNEVEALWPAWLSKQWLPYLRAAWTLRSGQAEAFKNQRRQISESSGFIVDSLAEACQMLGAAQWMRATADDVKRLRAPVDRAIKNLKAISIEELIAVGGYFWDLHRIRLVYPAYRMHGAKFGKELLARWRATPGLLLTRIQEEPIHKAVLWCSEYRFWSDGAVALPSFFSDPAVQRHPMFAAAKLNAFLKARYHWGSESYREQGPILRTAAQSQRDAYYRHWFQKLANDLDDVLAKESSQSFRFPFGDLFGSDVGDDDDGEVDLDFDPDCDCAECQAARRFYEAARAPGSAKST